LRAPTHRQRPAGHPQPSKARPTDSLPDLIGRNLPLPLPVPDWSKPIILSLLLVSVGFGARAWSTSLRARRLERAQQTLEADIDAMQSALVPEIPSRIGELDITVAYRPADGPAAGGDFYDVLELERGRVAIILGDVSGHGRAALAQAARMRYTVRAYIEAGLDPRNALKLAARAIGSSPDGMFTTVVVAVHDPRSESLTYSTAGHPAPLITGETSHEPITSYPSPPLGWGVPCGCRQTTIPFPKTARACFFSDGLPEAPTEDGLLGRSGLEAIFGELAPGQPAKGLLQAVQDRAVKIRDDMAACIVTARAGSAGPLTDDVREELELDLEQLARGHAGVFLDECKLDQEEIAEALLLAETTALEHGRALLSVSLQRRTWTVTPPAAATGFPPPAFDPAAGAPTGDSVKSEFVS
jgi:Stage II sporulation protein E (SpoIIE)